MTIDRDRSLLLVVDLQACLRTIHPHPGVALNDHRAADQEEHRQAQPAVAMEDGETVEEMDVTLRREMRGPMTACARMLRCWRHSRHRSVGAAG